MDPMDASPAALTVRVTSKVWFVATALIVSSVSCIPGVSKQGVAPPTADVDVVGGIRVTLLRRAAWAHRPPRFDPDLPGIHIVGDIGGLQLTAAGADLPRAFAIAIATSPGHSPMMEGLTVLAGTQRFMITPFRRTPVPPGRGDGADQPGYTLTPRPHSLFRFESTTREIIIRFLPSGMSLLRGGCTLEWVDWYR